jgi:uncharacterized protein
MWLRRPLDDILSSPAKVAVLRVLLRINAPLSGREIERRGGIVHSAAHRALQALVASGVLSKQDHGRATTYALRDPDAPLLLGLKELFDREERRTRLALTELAEGIPGARAVILFGSEARGEARPGSDTDLLVIVDARDEHNEARVRDTCLDLAQRHSLALSWHAAGLDEVRGWDATDDQFWRNVIRDGIWLHGDSLEALRLKWRLDRTTFAKPGGSGT